MSNTEFLGSSNIEIQLFIEGRTQMVEFEVEQGWDYTRHIMSSIYSSMVKNTDPKSIIKLKRDERSNQKTKYEQQLDMEWVEKMKKGTFIPSKSEH